MPQLIKKIISVGLLFLVVLGVLFGLLLNKEQEKLDKVRQRVFHSYHVIENIQLLFNKIKDAELGQQSFIITGDEAYLQPYYAATIAKAPPKTGQYVQPTTIVDVFSELRKLTGDNSLQQERFNILGDLITQKLRYLEHSINIRTKHGMYPAMLLLKKGDDHNILEEMRLIIKNLTNEEYRLLAMRMEFNEKYAQRSATLIAIYLLISMSIIIVCYSLVTKCFPEMVKAQKALPVHTSLLAAMVNHMDEGVSLFDVEKKLLFANKHCMALLNVPEYFATSGITLSDMLMHMYQQGKKTDASYEKFACMMGELMMKTSFDYTYYQSNGMVIAIHGKYLPDVGYILFYHDMTKARTTSPTPCNYVITT